ncbi:hypothetical protein CASFOL_034353 [Castilleja foliolosa]|uniref:Uncharacterized protein n=1 Tax=Castilleja foliolosa TaxID=1961234 RepID=A0ABD3BX60_9LAMI
MRDGSPAAVASVEDFNTRSMDAALAKEAALLLEAGKIVDCMRIMHLLLQKKENDPKCGHSQKVEKRMVHKSLLATKCMNTYYSEEVILRLKLLHKFRRPTTHQKLASIIQFHYLHPQAPPSRAHLLLRPFVEKGRDEHQNETYLVLSDNHFISLLPNYIVCSKEAQKAFEKAKAQFGHIDGDTQVGGDNDQD